jgi:predicted DNA repair protein MutK
VLAVVGIGITVAVYGAVALIVKADDAGVALASNSKATALGAVSRTLGRALVLGMPGFLAFLSVAGTAAMIWVGGGIIVHGLEHYGLTTIGHVIHAAGHMAAHALPAIGGLVDWIVTAALAGVLGLVVGALSIPLAGYVIAPAWKQVKAVLRRRERVA